MYREPLVTKEGFINEISTGYKDDLRRYTYKLKVYKNMGIYNVEVEKTRWSA